MATWASLDEARDWWPDAPLDDGLLTDLLAAAQYPCEAYAPALNGAEPPSAYMVAVVLEAREIWSAREREGDVLGFGEGDFAIRVRPLSSTVKSLLRPQRGIPHLWSKGGSE